MTADRKDVWRVVPLLLFAASIGPAAGCNSGPAKAMQASSRNLMAIYKAFKSVTETRGQAPTKATLLEELTKLGESESVLRSPEDGEEYVILWDARIDA